MSWWIILTAGTLPLAVCAFAVCAFAVCAFTLASSPESPLIRSQLVQAQFIALGRFLLGVGDGMQESVRERLRRLEAEEEEEEEEEEEKRQRHRQPAAYVRGFLAAERSVAVAVAERACEGRPQLQERISRLKSELSTLKPRVAMLQALSTTTTTTTAKATAADADAEKREIARTCSEKVTEMALNLGLTKDRLEKSNRRLQAADAEAAELRAENHSLSEELRTLRAASAAEQAEKRSKILALEQEVERAGRHNAQLVVCGLRRRDDGLAHERRALAAAEQESEARRLRIEALCETRDALYRELAETKEDLDHQTLRANALCDTLGDLEAGNENLRRRPPKKDDGLGGGEWFVV